MKVVRAVASYLAILCVAGVLAPSLMRAAANPPLRVYAATAYCRAHPVGREQIWLRGWFIPVAEGDFTDGGLFDSQEALPLVTVDQWDANGNWRRYGAIFVRIRTRTPVGPRTVTVHGRLDCATARLVTDRDPFALPRLAVSYGVPNVEPNGAVTTWAMSGGLQLTLHVPRRSYPRNALAQVHVTLRNVSNHDVGYWLQPGLPVGYAVPQAEVLDATGKIVFPPAMPYAPALPGPVASLAPLHPGASVSTSEYIVVRGARLRATQNFMPRMTTNLSLPPYVLTTRPIVIHLTSEPSPKLSLYGAPAHAFLNVTRPPNVQGPMLSVRYADCGIQPPTMAHTYTEGWVTSNLHLTPGCSPLFGWHVRVAWLNHPVAALDYIPPQPSPTLLPTPSRPALPTQSPTALPMRSPTALPTPTRAVPASPGFTTLLRRAAAAMASVHAMHIDGIRSSIDSSNQLHLQIQGDCASQPGNGLPIALRMLSFGRQSQVGRIDEGYIIRGPVLPAPHTVTHAWHRSVATHEAWRVVDLHTQPSWGPSTAPVFDPDPAYVNQLCPDVLRLTYLAAPLRSSFVQHLVLGTERLAGHRVWHLRYQAWSKADLYIDATTFRVLRLRLWNGIAPGTRWQIRFDYSRFNVPVRITVPKG